MSTYMERSTEAQALINSAITFETNAIHNMSYEPNPFKAQILALEDGEALWEGIEYYLENF